MIAEIFGIGPIRVEALKHFLTRVIGDTGALVTDRELHAFFIDGNVDFDHTLGRGERHRIVEQILDHPLESYGHTIDQSTAHWPLHFDALFAVLGSIFAAFDDAFCQSR